MKDSKIQNISKSKAVWLQLNGSSIIRLGFFCVFSFALGLTSLAQDGADARPGQLTMTPDASALFKSTDIPVNLSTGVPNISIPIYNIELNGFSLPIGLSYNSSGLRVDEVSSNVGLGWSLQAGGMISSAVNGMPDFGQNGYLNSSLTFPTDRELNPTLTMLTDGTYQSNEDYDLCMTITGEPRAGYGNSEASPGLAGIYDTQPDLFYYNIAGLSGKFFMDKTLKAYTVPFKPISIQKPQGGGFIIIDESGNRFEFLVSETLQIATSSFSPYSEFGGGTSNVENTNYLISKIVTASGDELVFEYANMSYYYSNAPSYTRYRVMGSYFLNWPNNAEVRYETTNYVFGKRLQKITSTSNVEVSFNYATCSRLDLSKTSNQTGAFALEGVSIKKGDEIQTVSFVQDYINFTESNQCTANSNEDSYRLRLKEVHLPGKPPYKFEYFGGDMPSRFNESKDHWGYFSSSGGRYFNDPKYGFFGQTKEPSLSGTLQGVLSKIQYPSGGYSLLEYELNKARDTFNTDNISVQQKGAALYYNDQESGVRNVVFELDQFYDPGSLFIRYNTTQGPAQEGYGFDVWIYGPDNYSKSFLSLQGNDIQFLNLIPGTYTLSINQQGVFEEGYAQVFWSVTTSEPVETIGDIQLGGLRLKQVSNFDDFSEIPSSVKRYEYVSDDGISSGRVSNKPTYYYPLSKFKTIYPSETYIDEARYYVQNSSSALPLSGLQGYHILYTQVKEYQVGEREEGYTIHKFNFVNDLSSYAIYPYVTNLSFDWKRGLPISNEVYKYDVNSDNYVLTKKSKNKYSFLHSNHDFGVFSETLAYHTPPEFPNEAHGLGLKVENLYPEFEINITGIRKLIPAIFQISISKMISAWYYLESTTEEEFDPTGTTTYSLETKYFYDNPEHAQLSRKENILSDGNIIKEFTLYPLDFSDNTGFISQLKTNKIINKPIETVQLKDHGTNQVVVGGSVFTYKNTGKGLVDKVFNLEGENIDLANFKFSNRQVGQLPEGGVVGDFLMDGQYQEKMHISMYNTKGNPLQVLSSNGMVLSYLWSYKEQLPVAKATNAYWNTIAHTSFESDDKGGWNYTDNAQNSVKAKTGDFYYNLSSGQISRSGIGATPSKPYKLSFWARTSTGTNNWLFMGQTEPLTNEWKLIERIIDGNSVTIIGSNILIDELRLHPIEAFMETYTHKPEIGIKSQTDANNRTYYYEYDAFGRLVGIKDEDGNLVKQHEYHYKGQ